MGTHLYVGNLPAGANEAILRMAFSQGGRKVLGIEIAFDHKTGRSLGHAFVEMATETDARAAVQALDGSDLDGKPVRVSEGVGRRGRR
jgi:RNA recognition motif-containing protein